MKEKERKERIAERVTAGKPMLTMQEAAMFTGMSKHTLYRMTCSKQIKHYKPGGKLIYFSREDLINWMMQNPSGGEQ